MAFDPNSMTFDQLLAQARADYQSQAARKGDDPYMGMTSVGGLPAQIYFGGSQQDPWTRQNWDNAAPVDPWSNASFNYMDPAKANQKLGTNLSRGENGTIKATDYLLTGDKGMLGDMAQFVAAAATMGMAIPAMAGAGAAGGAGAAAGGAGSVAATDAAYLAAADAAGGLLPQYGTIGAYEAGIAGAGTGAATSGAGSAGTGAAGSGAESVGTSFSDARFAAQNPGLDPSYVGSGTAGSSFGIKDAVDVARAASTVNGLTNGGASQVADQTTTSRQSMDPRMEQWLYGNGTAGNPGLLSGWMNAAAAPQSAGMNQFGNAAMNYLGQNGAQDMAAARQASQGMMNSGLTAPQMGSAVMQAAQVNAPGQNNLDLSAGYNDMIYGQAGNNPYLTGAIQKGINQSSNAFGNMVSDATKATQGLLGDIRGGSIMNGQMGSSRQGIAESKALDSFNTQIGRAASQFGQNNTDAAVAAQAGAYDADRNRAAGLMSGLSGQQYGVASQNASMQQQAAMQNAQAQQQSLGNNLQSELSTQALNSQRQQYGIGATQGLLAGAYGYGNAQDNYGVNRAQQQSGLLAPYTGLNSSSTSQQPLYENKAGNVAAGLTGAAALFNIGKSFF